MICCIAAIQHRQPIEEYKQVYKEDYIGDILSANVIEKWLGLDLCHANHQPSIDVPSGYIGSGLFDNTGVDPCCTLRNERVNTETLRRPEMTHAPIGP